MTNLFPRRSRHFAIRNRISGLRRLRCRHLAEHSAVLRICEARCPSSLLVPRRKFHLLRRRCTASQGIQKRRQSSIFVLALLRCMSGVLVLSVFLCLGSGLIKGGSSSSSSSSSSCAFCASWLQRTHNLRLPTTSRHGQTGQPQAWPWKRTALSPALGRLRSEAGSHDRGTAGFLLRPRAASQTPEKRYCWRNPKP